MKHTHSQKKNKGLGLIFKRVFFKEKSVVVLLMALFQVKFVSFWYLLV